MNITKVASSDKTALTFYLSRPTHVFTGIRLGGGLLYSKTNRQLAKVIGTGATPKMPDVGGYNGIPLPQLIQTNVTRFVTIIMITFIVSILTPFYRYNIRLATFYDARADVLALLKDLKPLGFVRLAGALTPVFDFGKARATPIVPFTNGARPAPRFEGNTAKIHYFLMTLDNFRVGSISSPDELRHGIENCRVSKQRHRCHLYKAGSHLIIETVSPRSNTTSLEIPPTSKGHDGWGCGKRTDSEDCGGFTAMKRYGGYRNAAVPSRQLTLL